MPSEARLWPSKAKLWPSEKKLWRPWPATSASLGSQTAGAAALPATMDTGKFSAVGDTASHHGDSSAIVLAGCRTLVPPACRGFQRAAMRTGSVTSFPRQIIGNA